MQNHKKNVKHVKDEKYRENLKWNSKKKFSYFSEVILIQTNTHTLHVELLS